MFIQHSRVWKGEGICVGQVTIWSQHMIQINVSFHRENKHCKIDITKIENCKIWCSSIKKKTDHGVIQNMKFDLSFCIYTIIVQSFKIQSLCSWGLQNGKWAWFIEYSPKLYFKTLQLIVCLLLLKRSHYSMGDYTLITK